MADKKKKPNKRIERAEAKESAFIAKAKRKGITSSQLQENVLAEPTKYDDKTVKQARLRKTLVGLHNKKKTEE